MFKPLTAFLLTALFSLSVAAQSKYSATLKLFLASEKMDERFLELRDNVVYISLFIELEKGADMAALQKRGVAIRTLAGNIATADVPIESLPVIAAMPDIKRLELPLLFRRFNDTLMKQYTTVNKVLAGQAPLTVPYTGKGVVIGIIDDGIEFGHPDFLDSAGKTTIEAVWQMETGGRPPQGFSYGALLERDTLNTFLTSTYNSGTLWQWQQRFGSALHGTPVAALAAGRWGVAPGATLVAVALTAFTSTLLRSDRIVDGIAFIYQRAKAAGKKCIVNISLGTQWGGPHDGKTLVERAIDAYCEEKTDLLVCTSAGNDGNNWKHWGGMPVHADSSFGFASLASAGELYFSIPKQSSSTLSVSVTDSRSPQLNAPAISRDSILFQTPFLRIDSLIQRAGPVEYTSSLPNGRASASIRFTASHYNEAYDELIVSLREFTSVPNGNIDWHLNRFIFKGTGTVHGWFPFLNLHPQYFFGNNPYPNDPTYRSTDNDYSTAIPTNAFSVLSSGAYNIRNCYVNQLQQKVFNFYPSCQLTYFTSRGPTLDGRIKPDVLSPGENVLSARGRWSDFLGHHFIVDSSYEMFSGTSAASPITAGIAALLWERFPEFDRARVIQQIKATAYADNYTAAGGPLPNNVAGWGKTDAFRALTGITTDLASLCSDVLICKIDVPVVPLQEPLLVNGFRVFPNPAPGSVWMQYKSGTPLRLLVYNAIGQQVHTMRLPVATVTRTERLPLYHLPSGLYFFECTGKDFFATEKVLLGR